MRQTVNVEKQGAVTLYYLSDEGHLRKTANARKDGLLLTSRLVATISIALWMSL